MNKSFGHLLQVDILNVADTNKKENAYGSNHQIACGPGALNTDRSYNYCNFPELLRTKHTHAQRLDLVAKSWITLTSTADRDGRKLGVAV